MRQWAYSPIPAPFPDFSSPLQTLYFPPNMFLHSPLQVSMPPQDNVPYFVWLFIYLFWRQLKTNEGWNFHGENSISFCCLLHRRQTQTNKHAIELYEALTILDQGPILLILVAESSKPQIVLCHITYRIQVVKWSKFKIHPSLLAQYILGTHPQITHENTCVIASLPICSKYSQNWLSATSWTWFPKSMDFL